MAKSRSEPQLMCHHDPDLRQTEVVLAVQGVWAVVYDSKPIGLVLEKGGGRSWRYPKTVFTAPGFAIRLARRLNKQFDTRLFSVRLMSDPV